MYSTLLSVSETACISPASVSSSAAASLLPIISQSHVNLLIEQELMKPNKPTAAVSRAAGIVSHGSTSGDEVSNMSVVTPDSAMSSRSGAVEDQYKALPPVSDVTLTLSLDTSDGHGLTRLENKESVLCSVLQISTVGELQPKCSQLDPTTNLKKSDTVSVSSEFIRGRATARQTGTRLLPDRYIEHPFQSSTGLCKTRLSYSEINNNCRRTSASSSHTNKFVVGGVGAAVRKSKRCNRGRRYNELMMNGILRKHPESLTT